MSDEEITHAGDETQFSKEEEGGGGSPSSSSSDSEQEEELMDCEAAADEHRLHVEAVLQVY